MNLADAMITVTFGLLAGLAMKIHNEPDAEKMYNKMDDVIRFLNENNIDDDIKKKIRNFYSYSWSL